MIAYIFCPTSHIILATVLVMVTIVPSLLHLIAGPVGSVHPIGTCWFEAVAELRILMGVGGMGVHVIG